MKIGPLVTINTVSATTLPKLTGISFKPHPVTNIIRFNMQ